MAAVDRGAVSVLVADDHPMFRLGLAMALRSLGFGRVDEAEDGERSLALARSHRYDVLILDLRMPGRNGLEVAEAIRQDAGGAHIVMLTTYDEPAIVRAARDAGVSAFLGKDTEPGHLARIIDRLLGGGAQDGLGSATDVPNLSLRERDVLRLLAAGLAQKQVASELGISAETVKDHVANLYAKLGVRERVSAIQRARTYGWLMLDELRSERDA